jgi:hypothetical protein
MAFQFSSYLCHFQRYQLCSHARLKCSAPRFFLPNLERILAPYAFLQHSIHQTLISLSPSIMATSSSVILLVSFARDNGYVYLPGIPTSFCPEAPWFIPSLSAPSHPMQLGQHVLLVSMTSRRTFFGRLRSVTWLERSYVVISVSPLDEAYGSFLPAPCTIFIPISSIVLPTL